MQPAVSNEEFLSEYEASVDEIFARCVENAPNFAVSSERFKTSVNKSLLRFAAAQPTPPTREETLEFLSLLQADDLFIALACADGNERAWWEIDQQYRGYLERLARHLAKTDVDAQDVIDCVYVELYGTRFVDGERVSKFATYSGRGSLRGWLRTVIWHTLVDLHRASHDEVSLDEMTENAGEGAVHASFANQPPSGDVQAVEQISRDRYRIATTKSIESAFSSLEDHEKLLLLYYHVEQLKLREIARLVENEGSPLRRWFQRRAQSRTDNSQGRIHESTVMRWLDKSYAKVLQLFRSELESTHDLTPAEVEICMELVTEDLGGSDLFQKLTV
jgi:RNA polymerase sigma-70 factor (ECF subfamily)